MPIQTSFNLEMFSHQKDSFVFPGSDHLFLYQQIIQKRMRVFLKKLCLLAGSGVPGALLCGGEPYNLYG